MPAPTRVVGALIRDARHRVYVHRRTNERRLLPGTWDVVGGHVEAGETSEQALARELAEETGWRLRRIEAVVADWEWEWDGVVRRELDYLVEVDGDLGAPRLEEGKHDAYDWVGPDDLDLLMRGRTDGDRRLRDIVAKAVRTRLTERLRLEPIGASWESAGVGTWMAYDRADGELVGRGWLTRLTPDAEVTRQIAAVLPGAGWDQDRLELGLTIRSQWRGRGLASQIGAAGLAFAFDTLGAAQVIAVTELHNVRTRAVMERLRMTYVGEIVRTGPVEGRDGVHEGAPFAVYVAGNT